MTQSRQPELGGWKLKRPKNWVGDSTSITIFLYADTLVDDVVLKHKKTHKAR